MNPGPFHRPKLLSSAASRRKDGGTWRPHGAPAGTILPSLTTSARAGPDSDLTTDCLERVFVVPLDCSFGQVVGPLIEVVVDGVGLSLDCCVASVAGHEFVVRIELAVSVIVDVVVRSAIEQRLVPGSIHILRGMSGDHPGQNGYHRQNTRNPPRCAQDSPHLVGIGAESDGSAGLCFMVAVLRESTTARLPNSQSDLAEEPGSSTTAQHT